MLNDLLMVVIMGVVMIGTDGDSDGEEDVVW